MNRLLGILLIVTTGSTTFACTNRSRALLQRTGTLERLATLRIIEQLGQRCMDWPYRVAFQIRGTIGSNTVRTRVIAGLDGAGMRIEPESPSDAPAWTFVGRNGEAMIVLKDGRLFGPSAAESVVRKLLGIGIPIEAFARTLLACEFGDPSTMSDLGERWGRLPAGTGGTLFLRRSKTSDLWRPQTLFYSGGSLQWIWRVDYSDYEDEYPQRMRLRSPDGRVDLDFRLLQLDRHVNLRGGDFFQLAMPPNSRLMPLDALADGEVLTTAGSR